MVGRSKEMQKVYALIRKVADTPANALILGESGTGKELVARAIHDNSARKGKPFVAINCGGIPENLLESELFGCMKGSFTGAYADRAGLFEVARGGTIFLDEIAELPVILQVKLLASSRRGRSAGSAAPRTSRSTCGSSRRPTSTSRRK
jgi:two-component system response regulator PilR (NtrC family)